jgi:hypothetical protein
MLWNAGAQQWESEVPPAGLGQPVVVTHDHPVVAAVADDSHSYVGGHAFISVEHIDVNGSGTMYYIDFGGQSSGDVGSGIQHWPAVQQNVNPMIPGQYWYQSWQVTELEFQWLLRAVARFTGKLNQGRYSFNLAGGALGSVLSLPGKRGINCAGFVQKVLREAGIVRIEKKFIMTPRHVAGH